MWAKALIGTAEFLMGYAWRGVLDRKRRRSEQPYSWSCPLQACSFTVKGSDQGIVLAWAEAHERTEEHGKEFPP